MFATLGLIVREWHFLFKIKARNPTDIRQWVVHVIPYSGHKYNFLTKFHINAQILIRNIVEVFIIKLLTFVSPCDIIIMVIQKEVQKCHLNWVDLLNHQKITKQE